MAMVDYKVVGRSPVQGQGDEKVSSVNYHINDGNQAFNDCGSNQDTLQVLEKGILIKYVEDMNHGEGCTNMGNSMKSLGSTKDCTIALQDYKRTMEVLRELGLA